MTCPHTNYTGQKKRDNICIDCWRERAEKSESDCAEMRSVLLGIFDGYKFDETSEDLGMAIGEFSVRDLRDAEHALSSDSGKGWLSPERLENLRKEVVAAAKLHDFVYIEMLFAKVKEGK